LSNRIGWLEQAAEGFAVQNDTNCQFARHFVSFVVLLAWFSCDLCIFVVGFHQASAFLTF